MKRSFAAFATVATLTVLADGPSAAVAADSPNVVYVLADDLGWGDLGVNGGSIPTPAIDQLFKDGVRLDNYMGWCVCSPTRAMLLTGRHPYRVGTGPETGGELAKEETTIAEAFRANGYRTGVFGKWHNGDDPATPEFNEAYAEAWKDRANRAYTSGGLGVNEHGFDEARVFYGGGPDHFTRRISGGKGPVSWWHNREHRPQDAGYTDDLVTRHAVEFIRDNKDRPFFCYVPFNNIHGPMQAKDTDLEAVDPKVKDESKRVYAAMTQALDRNVADILAELDQYGLRENTIIVFTSDNGATREGSNLPFRGGKHSLFEGGTHLPTVIHWPKGKMVKGTWDGLCGALDMFPTLVDMAGLKMPATRPLDGKNLWPALRENTASPVDSYYWSWHNEDAIRTADWRMHRFTDHVELYDIRKDIGETTNVAEKNPEVVATLMKKMDAWVESMGVALSHVPPPESLHTKPAPQGEVLEITVTVADKATPKDSFLVPFARWDGHVFATDYVEYDLAVAPGSPLRGFYYTPFKGNNQQTTPHFKRGEGVDQFGREQIFGPEPTGGAGVWEHRVIGLSSYSPGIAPGHGVVFKGAKPGTYKVYIDNLRICHANGKTTPIWSSGQDTRAVKLQENDLFKDLTIRTANAADVGR
jgi:arylsulfatase A-like enzyme